MIDIFSYILGKNKESKETEKYKQIVDDTETALQEKLALDEPISKDDVVSTIQGIDVAKIMKCDLLKNNVEILNIDTNNDALVDFENASKLNIYSVYAPLVKIIGKNALFNCISLQSVYFPSAKTIGDNALYNCISLQQLELPCVTSIGNYAMYQCFNLKTVKLGANQVATISNSRVFAYTPIANGTGYIYVPDELVEDYKTATNWSVYADQIRPMSEYKEE